MDSSKIIEDITNGDATAPEVVDWCCENGLKCVPKDVLLVFLEEFGDGEYLMHDLSVEDGIGSYLNLDLLKFLVEKGIFKDEPETWFDVFCNEESSWDYDILKYLLVDLKLEPSVDNGFNLESLWQDKIFELAFVSGVKYDGDEIKLLKFRGMDEDLLQLRNSASGSS